MIKYNDWVLDSDEELYFCYWLDTLKSVGLVEYFTRVEDSILLFNKVSFDFVINGKSLSKHVLNPMSYTPDFLIKWAKKAEGLLVARINGSYSKQAFKRCFFYTEDDFTSIVDVKGTFKGTGLTSSITFPIIQKILVYNQDIFVQKVVPFGSKGLFSKTFTPKEYLFTSTGKIRKIKWEVRTLEDYLNP